MARATRSSKINIAEDDTAFIAAQIPLPSTPAPRALTESTEINTMAPEDNEEHTIAQQMKNLKAAYRTALGINKKGNKKKNKKKGKQDGSAETRHIVGSAEQIEHVDNIVGHLHPAGVTPNTTSLHTNEHRGADSTSNQIPSWTPQPSMTNPNQLPTTNQSNVSHQPMVGRTTRGQLARQQQAGQYITGVSLTGEAAATDMFWGPPRNGDFISSLCNGPPRFPLETGNFIATRFEYTTNPFNHLAMKNMEDKNAKNSQLESFQTTSNENDRPTSTITFPSTKAKAMTIEKVERVYDAEKIDTPTRPGTSSDDDSFIEHIISRSPAKPVSRIEDSLEEFDNLEDAIDALDEATLAEQIVNSSTKKKVSIASDVFTKKESKASPRLSMANPIATPEVLQHTPLKQRTVSTQRPKSAYAGYGIATTEALQRSPVNKATASTQRPKSTYAGYATVRVKVTAPKESILKKSKSMTFGSPSRAEKQPSVSPNKASPPRAPRAISLLPPKQTVKSTKPPTKAHFELPGEAIARRLKEQREARLAQRESSEASPKAPETPKIKSTKAPTIPTAFEFAGDAVSRRKKEAQQAKLKLEDEEDRKRREFKARPISRNVVSRTLPRDTAASRARQSKLGGLHVENGNLTVGKRGSLVGAHRPSILDLQKVNISAPRTKVQLQPSPQQSPNHHGPSMSGLAMQRTVSDADMEMQRQRAKDIYDRDAKLAEEMEREKRDREAAARRSREEAAEKGRQASREWAEKQKAKKATDNKQ